MLGTLVASKRFEFAASHYYRKSAWSDAKNYEIFGKHTLGKYGHGHNFILHVGFTGELDPNTGMIVELSHVKKDILAEILPHYDHYVLNTLPQFQDILPTPEAIAKQLLRDTQLVFANRSYQVHHVYLIESDTSAATAYTDGRLLRHLGVFIDHPDFYTLFGPGKISLSLTFSGQLDPFGFITGELELEQRSRALQESLRHMALPNNPCEAGRLLLHTACTRIQATAGTLTTPLGSIGLRDNQYCYSVTGQYTATHRLNNPKMSTADNTVCFGKCHRPHGHLFWVELTVAEIKTFHEFQQELDALLSEWDYQALDEHPDFSLCTTENMVLVLQKKWAQKNPHLSRIRLLETPNNRFSLRI